jgi:hypothetical protein
VGGQKNASLVDVVREVGNVNSMRELRGRASEDLFELACTSYSTWADTAKVAPPQDSADYLCPVLTPWSISSFDEVEPARRCVLACGRVAVQISDSINYARRMMRLLILLEEAINKNLVTLIPEGSGSELITHSLHDPPSSQAGWRTRRMEQLLHPALKLQLATCRTVRVQASICELGLSAWEVCGVAAPPPADWLTCRSTVPLTVRDRFAVSRSLLLRVVSPLLGFSAVTALATILINLAKLNSNTLFHIAPYRVTPSTLALAIAVVLLLAGIVHTVIR